MVLVKVEEKYEYLKDILLSLLLIGIAFIINTGISIKGLYMDDLLCGLPEEERDFSDMYFRMR